jgi:hypothetical protein
LPAGAVESAFKSSDIRHVVAGADIRSRKGERPA